MRWTCTLAVALIGLGLVARTQAQNVYKCKDAHGQIVYRDIPCANASRTKATYHFTKSQPAAEVDPAQQRRIAEYFIRRHPDVQLGHNADLMAQAMRTLNRRKISYWSLLSAGYAKASKSTQWVSASTRSARVATQQPKRERLPPSPTGGHGLGLSAYANGQIHAFRCSTPTGRVYYARSACGHSSIRVGSESIVRYTATDPRTGRIVAHDERNPGVVFDPVLGRMRQSNELTWTRKRTDKAVYRSVPDHATPVSVDEACAQAQKAAQKHPFSHTLTRRVYALCQQGRSLYDQKPARGSLYYDDDDGGR